MLQSFFAKNTKHETRNPKQIRIFKCSNFQNKCLGVWIFNIWYCFEFRYSNFGFILFL